MKNKQKDRKKEKIPCIFVPMTKTAADIERTIMTSQKI